MDCTTLSGDILARLSPSVLVALFDAGVSLGLGIAPDEPSASAEVAQLISTVRARWFGELEASRAWRRAEAAEPSLLRDEMPGWPLAACERQSALGDAQPPEGWGIEGWPV